VSISIASPKTTATTLRLSFDWHEKASFVKNSFRNKVESIKKELRESKESLEILANKLEHDSRASEFAEKVKQLDRFVDVISQPIISTATLVNYYLALRLSPSFSDDDELKKQMAVETSRQLAAVGLNNGVRLFFNDLILMPICTALFGIKNRLIIDGLDLIMRKISSIIMYSFVRPFVNINMLYPLGAWLCDMAEKIACNVFGYELFHASSKNDLQPIILEPLTSINIKKGEHIFAAAFPFSPTSLSLVSNDALDN